MANRDINNFLNNFSSYAGCRPPGVRLPTINIDDKYIDRSKFKKSFSNLEFLSLLCERSLQEKSLNNKTVYKKRLKYEIETLHDLGFVDYILLNWDILNFCHENDIPTGPGRGSAAGSLVLFLIGVTKVDPIKYDLFFERFVSKSRARKTEEDGVTFLDGSLLADVDNDIAYEHRPKVIKYIEDKYPGKTAKILTLNTLSGKLCVKECGKIVNVFSEEKVNLISGMIPKEFGQVMKLSLAYEANAKFKKIMDENPELYKISLQLEGLNKNTGVHPSGIAISHDNIDTICPIQKTNDGSIVTGYDMNWVAELMVKFDILGLRTLSIVYSTCEQVGISPTEIELDSNDIYSNLQDLNQPHGLFQIEANTNFSVCRKIRPKNLESLSAVIALARPGAMDFVDNYRAYVDTGNFQSLNSFYDDVLSYTGGIPLYQEQLMKMAVKIGFTLEESESLRRIIGKKKVDQMPEWKSKIESKVKKNNLDPVIGDILWKVAEDSANYSFNKSHSISYSILSAWTCYLKFAHPKEFFLSLLKMTSFEPNPQEEISKISQELMYFNIELLPPDLAKSSMDFKIEGNNIRYGLNSIKGISSKSLQNLKDFIDSDVPNKYDIFLSAKSSGLNIGVLSSLIQAGALSSYKTNRPRLVLEAQVFNLLTDREKRNFCLLGDKYNYDILNAIHNIVTKEIKGDDGKHIMKASRFETLKKKYIKYKLIYEQNKNYEKFANWYFEYNLLGFSYSVRLRNCFSSNTDLNDSLFLHSAEINSKNKYIGIVTDCFSGKSKNGNDYFKMDISDETGSYSALFVDGRDKRLSKYKRKSVLPEKGSIVVMLATKSDEVVFVENLSMLDEKIYMKLSDLK